MTEQLYTIRELAARFAGRPGCTKANLQWAIRQGRIKATRITTPATPQGFLWQVSLTDFQAWLDDKAAHKTGVKP